MYLKFYRFKEEPFNLTPNPRFLFLSRQHEIALASLIYGVEYRKGFMVLTGEVGTGKSTVARAFVQRLDKKVKTAIILNPFLSVLGILKSINNDFGNTVESETVEGQISGLNEFLLRQVKRKKNAVVLIDEAQNLSVESLEMIRLLSNLETDQEKLLQIVLVGQPELDQTLGSSVLRQLNQRISVRCRLKHLTYEETKDYVQHRLLVAREQGLMRATVQFEERAFRKVFHITSGFPRMINILCDRALLEACTLRTRFVTKNIVSRAWDDVSGDQLPRKRRRFLPWLRELLR